MSQFTVPNSPLGPDYHAPWVAPASPAHLEQITRARKAGAKIRRAVAVSVFSGWTTAIFGAITMLLSLFSLTGLILGAGMCIISMIEFRGSSALKRLDPRAPRTLAINQCALGGILFIYGAISLWSSLHNPIKLPSLIGTDPQISQMLEGFEGLEQTIYIAVYVSVMLVAIVGPGLTAIYYYSRGKIVEAYINETPQWILELQRAGMSV